MAKRTRARKRKTTESKETKETSQPVEEVDSREGSRSIEIARKGIQTGGDFAQMMSALMSDVIEGKITPQVANATVNAGGKLLKVVDLQLKYGKQEIIGKNQFRLIE